MDTEVLFYLLCGAVILVMAVYHFRRKHRFASLIFGSVTGFAALLISHRYGGAIGADLPLNPFNVAGSVVLGVPFIAVMIIIKYL